MEVIIVLWLVLVSLGVGFLGLRFHKKKWQESEQESKSLVLRILMYIGYTFVGAILAFLVLIGMMMLMLFLS